MISQNYIIFCRDSQSNRNMIFEYLSDISIIGFNHFHLDNTYCFSITGKIEAVFGLSQKLTKFDCVDETNNAIELYKARKMFLEMLLNWKGEKNEIQQSNISF